MKRRTLLQAATLLTAQAALPPLAAHAEPATAQAESRRRIARALAAALALQRRDWEQGALAQALLEAGERDTLIRVTRGAMLQATPDGRLGVVVSGGVTDPAMGGAAYAQAAKWTGDPTMQKAVDGLFAWIRHKAPRAADGTVYHVFEGPEMWSDGLFSAPPFLAALGDYDEALRQIAGHRARLWDAKKQLFAHIWDDGARQFKDPAAWGGGNGWAAAGMARVIEALPATRRADREQLAAQVRELLDGCLRHQRTDGLFHNVIDDPATFVETNLAQMLAYAIYTGVASGWLAASYRAHADALRTAAHGKMNSEGFVEGVCGAPDFDRPGFSTEAQAFCILMEAAAERAGA